MILCADLHLRKTQPRARTDDYWAAQERKFRFVLSQAQASPPLLVAGDFFHQPKPGEGLLRWTIDLLREYGVVPIAVPGQHDLPGHSLEQIGESGLGVLEAAGVITLLTDRPANIQRNIIWGVPYGKTPENVNWPQATNPNLGINNVYAAILLWHHMVINDPLWPGQEADKALGVLKKYSQFDLIVTGDNHQTFAIAEPARKGQNSQRWIVNPGSMMRMTAAQVDHKPCAFKWEGGKVEQIFLPIEPDVLDLSELEQAKEKDERIQAFVERLDQNWEAELSFEKNLEKFLQANEVDPDVKEMVWRCLE